MIGRTASRIWHSATITTWISFLARSGAIAIVLPFVVTRLEQPEIALWYLFSTIMTLQLLADMGFSSVFSRVLAFGLGGAGRVGNQRERTADVAPQSPNWQTVRQVHLTMRRVFIGLTAIWFIALGVGGYFASRELIQQLPDPATGWSSWGIVWLVSTFRLYGMQYVAYLIGTDNIPMLRRAESVVWLLILIGGPLVLMAGGGLSELVVITYALMALNILVNSALVRRVLSSYPYVPVGQPGQEVLRDIWPRVWRSGVGLILHAGSMQIAAVWYAARASAGEAATYLLAWNLLRAIDQFAQAPFYTKLPMLAKLQVQRKKDEQRQIAIRGMGLSAWVFAGGALTVGVIIPPLFEALNSNMSFADGVLWSLLIVGGFLERYGAMHLQLYSTTNHIVWHVANGVTGAIYLTVLFLLFARVGVYALPIAQIIANGSWYAWYSSRKSHTAYDLKFPQFDLRVFALPFAILIIYFLSQLTRSSL